MAREYQRSRHELLYQVMIATVKCIDGIQNTIFISIDVKATRTNGQLFALVNSNEVAGGNLCIYLPLGSKVFQGYLRAGLLTGSLPVLEHARPSEVTDHITTLHLTRPLKTLVGGGLVLEISSGYYPDHDQNTEFCGADVLYAGSNSMSKPS
jgi:hypothetical protein